MQLIFSEKQKKIAKPIIPPIEIKPQTKREIFILPQGPNPFQYMVQRLQFENPHCNSCGK